MRSRSELDEPMGNGKIRPAKNLRDSPDDRRFADAGTAHEQNCKTLPIRIFCRDDRFRDFLLHSVEPVEPLVESFDNFLLDRRKSFAED